MPEILVKLEEILLSALDAMASNFWEMFLILVILFRRELRWMAIIVLGSYIIWKEVPAWLWIIITAIGTLTELAYVDEKLDKK